MVSNRVKIATVGLLTIGAALLVARKWASSSCCTKIAKDTETTKETTKASQDSEPVLRELTREERLEAGVKAKEKGNKFFKAKKFDSAIRCYTESIDVLPKDSQEMAIALCNRAACHFAKESHEKVILDCTESLKINPSYSKALERRARSFERVGRIVEAISDYTACLLLCKFQNQEMITKTEQLSRQEGEKIAAELFSAENSCLPSNTTIKEYFGCFPKVDISFNENFAEMISKQEFEGYLEKGKMHLSKQEFGDAMNCFSVASAKLENSEACHLNACFLYLTGNVNGAIEELNRSLAINPENSDALMKRGLMKLEMNDVNGLIEDIEKAEKISPDDPCIAYHRAEVLTLNNDLKTAVVEYNRALSLCPTFEMAIMHRARTQLSLNNLQAAKREVKEALKSVQSAQLFCTLGEILAIESRVDEAKSLFNQAIKIDPKSPLPFLGLSMVSPSEAEQHLMKAIEIDPLFVSAYLQLANLASSRGEDPTCWFDKALKVSKNLPEMSQCATMKVAMEAQAQAIRNNPALSQVLSELMASVQQQ